MQQTIITFWSTWACWYSLQGKTWYSTKQKYCPGLRLAECGPGLAKPAYAWVRVRVQMQQQAPHTW